MQKRELKVMWDKSREVVTKHNMPMPITHLFEETTPTELASL